jgi:transposase-like protein
MQFIGFLERQDPGEPMPYRASRASGNGHGRLAWDRRVSIAAIRSWARHDVTRQQIYQWRSELRSKGLLPATPSKFVSVELTTEQDIRGPNADTFVPREHHVDIGLRNGRRLRHAQIRWQNALRSLRRLVISSQIRVISRSVSLFGTTSPTVRSIGKVKPSLRRPVTSHLAPCAFPSPLRK